MLDGLNNASDPALKSIIRDRFDDMKKMLRDFSRQEKDSKYQAVFTKLNKVLTNIPKEESAFYKAQFLVSWINKLQKK